MHAQTSSQPFAPYRRLGFLVLILLLLTWALRLYRLDGQSFWYDEGYAVYTAGLGPAQAFFWSSRDLVPPLHGELLAVWLPVAGQTEFAARFLSVWAGTLLVAGFVRLGADLRSWRAGLLAGLLAALSPLYIWHSQNVRMYILQALLGLLATMLLLRALRHPRCWQYWVGLTLLDGLMLYTQTTSLFLFAFHAALLLFRLRKSAESQRLLRGGLALGAALLLWLPWAVYALRFWGENAGYWPGLLDWRFVLAGAVRGFVTGEMMTAAEETAALVVWGAGCLAGLITLLFSWRKGGWWTSLLLLAHFVVPVALMAWLFRHVPKFSPRYLILAAPPLFLLPAMAVDGLLKRAGRWRAVCAATAVLLLAALVATAGLGLRHLYFDPAFARSDFRTAARLVQTQMADDEIVLLVPGPIFPAWQYYAGPDGWAALPDDPILNVNHVLHYRNTAALLNDLLAGRSGAWLVEWEPQMVDPTGVVAALLEQVGEEVPLTEQPTGLRLRHYRLFPECLPLPDDGPRTTDHGPLPSAVCGPDLTPSLETNLDLPLDPLGCVLPLTPGDEAVLAACYWQARASLPLHLAVSARLEDTDGVEWGRADGMISGPYLVAGRWPLDEPVLGRYALFPFPGTPPGDFYRLRLVVYEPGGPPHGAATVGPLTISPPAHPFTATLAAGQVVSASLGGLVLEAAAIRPTVVPPGEEVQVEAIWRVTGPFEEPRLSVGDGEAVSLLPEPGATSAWAAGDRYRTIRRVPVSPYAAGGPTTVWAASADGRLSVGSVQVDVTRTFTLPTGVSPLGCRLGESLALAGAEVSPEEGAIEVTLYWQALAFTDRAYTVFLHLVGPDGQVYDQADAQPQAGRHPTNHWLPGEVVPDRYRLSLPEGAPPGEYRLLAGLYDLTSMARLPVRGADCPLAGEDAIILGGMTNNQ